METAGVPCARIRLDVYGLRFRVLDRFVVSSGQNRMSVALATSPVLWGHHDSLQQRQMRVVPCLRRSGV